jgi:hypothetical protein
VTRISSRSPAPQWGAGEGSNLRDGRRLYPRLTGVAIVLASIILGGSSCGAGSSGPSVSSRPRGEGTASIGSSDGSSASERCGSGSENECDENGHNVGCLFTTTNGRVCGQDAVSWCEATAGDQSSGAVGACSVVMSKANPKSEEEVNSDSRIEAACGPSRNREGELASTLTTFDISYLEKEVFEKEGEVYDMRKVQRVRGEADQLARLLGAVSAKLRRITPAPEYDSTYMESPGRKGKIADALSAASSSSRRISRALSGLREFHSFDQAERDSAAIERATGAVQRELGLTTGTSCDYSSEP